MRALSLWQPWASAVALGHKRVETRHWDTRYRGPLAIHAAKRWTADERDFAADVATIDERLRQPPLGALVATCRLVSCLPTRLLIERGLGKAEQLLGNYADGRWGWVLEDIRPLATPVPFRGAQGLFDVPDELLGLAPNLSTAPPTSAPIQSSLL